MLDLSVSRSRSAPRIADPGDSGEAILRAIWVLGEDAVIWAVADLIRSPVAELLVELDVLVAAGKVTGSSPLGLTARGASEVAAMRIPPGRRIQAHLEAAGILRNSGAGAEAVAGQLLHAGPAGLPWAVETLRAAALEARERSDVRRAESYLRLALSERLDGSQRASVMVDLAALGGAGEAIDVLVKELRRTTDPAGVLVIVDAVRRLMVEQGRHAEVPALIELAADRVDSVNETAVQLRLQHAALRARSLTGVKALSTTADWFAQRATMDPSLTLPLRAVRASQATLIGRDAGPALADARAVLADPEARFENCWHALFALSTAAGPAELHATTVVLRNRLVGKADPWALAELDLFRAGALYRKGELQAAIRLLKNLLTRPEIRRNDSLLTGVVPLLAEVMVATGAGSGAAELLATRLLPDPKADLQVWPLVTHAHGLIQLAAEQFDLGLRSFLDCGSLLTSSGIENPELIRWRPGAVRALLRLGRRTEAVQLAEENLERATSYGAPGALAFAQFTLAMTRPTEDRGELLAQAVEGLGGAGQLLDEAQARYQYAKTLRATGHDRKADQQFLRVVSLADHCGVRPLAERARSQARSSAPASGVPGLTPQESKIARLAADGLSNAQIAKELFLVRRTVEFHLSGVYRKLQIAGRRQLCELLGVGVRPHVWDEV
ncbi:LuxR C-terminal-related transcriptional regulator [Kribbella sp. NPDC051587]|uniref:LuxR C-terminal-related transcriptional regulator n=1 Tax=Kribbella sp. NPDC051587 TaxID=3364119 RepID=UPI00378B6451